MRAVVFLSILVFCGDLWAGSFVCTARGVDIHGQVSGVAGNPKPSRAEAEASALYNCRWSGLHSCQVLSCLSASEPVEQPDEDPHHDHVH